MDINKAFKFRFYPNKEQKEDLARTFGCARKVYNDSLEIRKNAYQEHKQSVSYNELSFLLTLRKAREEYGYLNEVSSVVLTQSLRDLDKAYINFFKHKTGYPKLKSKMEEQSVRYAGNSFKYDRARSLTLAKMSGPLKIRWDRTIPKAAAERVTSVTLSKDRADRYFVSFTTIDAVAYKPVINSNVGLDLGLHDFVTLSTGEKVAHPRFYRKAEARIITLQKRLSRKQKGSKNREKARLKFAKAHARVKDMRKDFLHKLSSKLINENQVICVEDLAVCNMSRNRRLAKSIMDSGWGVFVRQLTYKASWYGRSVVKVGRFFPSSKTCSHCGTIKPQLSLSERRWTCPDCGTEHDRDVNAALNVLAEGISVLACGEVSSGVGAVRRNVKLTSVKQEISLYSKS